MPRPATSLFEDAIDIPLWLEADRLTPHAERSRRDREIGLTLEHRDRVQRVRGWWRVAAPDEEGAGARLERVRGAITAVMALLGAALGVSLALAAFQYDGSQPVNVVRLIALLVVIPALFLIASLLLLPGRVALLRGVQDLIAPLNPGALALTVFRRLTRASPELARTFDWRAGRSSAARFAKWQLMCWSQVAAVGFNIAVLATAVLLVTFTDLAFRWSTTLDVDPEAVTRIVQAIAWPWHAFVPSAVPSAELVEQSQFFRLDSGGLASGRALTAWWPFTLLTIVTYGLLPRLVLLGVAVVRLRAAEGALLLDDPRVTALVDRMASPAVETAAAEHAETVAGAVVRRGRLSRGDGPRPRGHLGKLRVRRGSSRPRARLGLASISSPSSRPAAAARSAPTGKRSSRWARASRARSSCSRPRGSRLCSSCSISWASSGVASAPRARSWWCRSPTERVP